MTEQKERKTINKKKPNSEIAIQVVLSSGTTIPISIYSKSPKSSI